jgi:hypothetical protein
MGPDFENRVWAQRSNKIVQSAPITGIHGACSAAKPYRGHLGIDLLPLVRQVSRKPTSDSGIVGASQSGHRARTPLERSKRAPFTRYLQSTDELLRKQAPFEFVAKIGESGIYHLSASAEFVSDCDKSGMGCPQILMNHVEHHSRAVPRCRRADMVAGITGDSGTSCC